MFVSKGALSESLVKLANMHPFFGFSFLAFKRASLPVGSEANIVFAAVMDRHLKEFYRPDPLSEEFYNPFQTSRPADRWLKPRYGSTSLQRITADTFGDCFLHETKTSSWGWRGDYIERLCDHLDGYKLPAFHLAVWLFRLIDIGPDASPATIIDRFRRDFLINDDEWFRLFDHYVPEAILAENKPIDEEDMVDLVGAPASSAGRHSAALKSLTISDVGPSTHLKYCPSARFNVVTGDNSVGKTFLLDAIWWSVTGTWASDSFVPSMTKARKKPSVEAEIRTGKNRISNVSSQFHWNTLSWKRQGSVTPQGLAIYAKHDGSFIVWDSSATSPDGYDGLRLVRLSPHEVRMGKISEALRFTVCNGMYRDWVSWQTNPSRYSDKWARLKGAIKALSPDDAILEAGTPVKIPPDDLEQPSIVLPYGEVPLGHASAAVSRILGLAYILVWSWSRHEENRATSMLPPARQITLLIDEIEAHLHPKWQRKVLPALNSAVASIAPSVNTQAHIVTHSPLVLASLEEIFQGDRDSLFKMDYDTDTVKLASQYFRKEGRVDRWLTSPVFGLDFARSESSSKAIKIAVDLMAAYVEDPQKISEVHRLLVNVLAQDDEFWARWMPYASTRANLV